MRIAAGSVSCARSGLTIPYNPAVCATRYAANRPHERSTMSTPRNVAVIVGSLRKESFNRKMAKAMIAVAPPSLKL
jgi:hypothetical protein